MDIPDTSFATSVITLSSVQQMKSARLSMIPDLQIFVDAQLSHSNCKFVLSRCIFILLITLKLSIWRPNFRGP